MLTNKDTSVQAIGMQSDNGNNGCVQTDSINQLMTTLSQSYNANAEIKFPISLEDATTKLVNIVPDIADMVLTAKLNCSNPDDGLTPDESASIMIYTMEWSPKENSFCYFLDKALRTNDKQQLQSWFLYLKLIFHALSKLKSKPRTVYQGVMSDVSANYLPGCIIVLPEFTTYATNVKTLEEEKNFENTGIRTLFAIECESSKDISQHSFRKTKDEIILMPGRRLQVVSCLNPNNDLHIIQMKEITS